MAALRLFAVAAVLCGAALIVGGNRIARIIEGVETPIEKAPFLVQLMFRDEENRNQMKMKTCGGVIVSDRHVLTAAHCFDGLHKHVADPETYLDVIAGASDKFWGSGPGEMYTVQSVKVYPKYKTAEGPDAELNPKYDLALLTVAWPFEFSDKIKPIEITKTRVPENTRVSVGGWGAHRTLLSFEFTENFRSNLWVAQQDIMPYDKCSQYLQGIANVPEDAKKSLLCTTNVDGGACNGDSGSGLWIEPKSDSEPAVLVGLVEGGVGCSLHHPGLYVDLADPEIQEFLIDNAAHA